MITDYKYIYSFFIQLQVTFLIQCFNVKSLGKLINQFLCSLFILLISLNIKYIYTLLFSFSMFSIFYFLIVLISSDDSVYFTYLLYNLVIDDICYDLPMWDLNYHFLVFWILVFGFYNNSSVIKWLDLKFFVGKLVWKYCNS